MDVASQLTSCNIWLFYTQFCCYFMQVWVFILVSNNYFGEIWSLRVVVILDDKATVRWEVAVFLIKSNDPLLRTVIDTEG